MQTVNIVGHTLTRKVSVQRVTPMQKFCMVVMGSIVLGSFVMLCLQETRVIESDSFVFSHILFSTLSAILGYLFGSNMKISMSGGEA